MIEVQKELTCCKDLTLRGFVIDMPTNQEVYG